MLILHLQYTSPAYTERTSRPCHSLSFTDLAQGLLPPISVETSSRSGEADNNSEPVWDIIVCSFALHLVTNPSELFALLFELSGKARWLIVVATHKKPEVSAYAAVHAGWTSKEHSEANCIHR